MAAWRSETAIVQDETVTYAAVPPFHPNERYPEFPSGPVGVEPNPVYSLVRRTLQLLKLDEPNLRSPAWNPLGDIVRPGQTVTVKPNFVLHFNSTGNDLHAVVTHGSVLRPLIDYILKALDGSGTVIVGDAPHGNADFDAIVEFTGARKLIEYYKASGFDVRLVDFRQYRYGHGKEGFLKETRTQLAGDPMGYTAVDLGKSSELVDLDHLERLYGADYDRSIIRAHHHENRHEYLIANSVLHADVVVSVPKLKVHSKAGVTINLKNLVGINGDKNWLPHYRVGNPSEHGDEFPASEIGIENSLRRMDRALVDAIVAGDSKAGKNLYRAFLKFYYPALGLLTNRSGNKIHRGNWRGNDTVWRMVLDLNKILLYADKNGILRTERQRGFFSLVDGIVAGEGDGPLGPTARRAGVLLAGFSPLLVDLVGTKLMGIDPKDVPLFKSAFRDRSHTLAPCDLNESTIIATNKPFEGLTKQSNPNLGFLLPLGWKSTGQPDRKSEATFSTIDEASE